MANFFEGLWNAAKHPFDEGQFLFDVARGKTSLKDAPGKHQEMMNKITVPILGDNKIAKNSDAIAGAIVGGVLAAPAIGGMMSGAGGSTGSAAGAGGSSSWFDGIMGGSGGNTDYWKLLNQAGKLTSQLEGGQGQSAAPQVRSGTPQSFGSPSSASIEEPEMEDTTGGALSPYVNQGSSIQMAPISQDNSIVNTAVQSGLKYAQESSNAAQQAGSALAGRMDDEAAAKFEKDKIKARRRKV